MNFLKTLFAWKLGTCEKAVKPLHAGFSVENLGFSIPCDNYFIREALIAFLI